MRRVLYGPLHPVGLVVPACFLGVVLFFGSCAGWSLYAGKVFPSPHDLLQWYTYHSMVAIAAIALVGYSIAYANVRQAEDHSQGRIKELEERIVRLTSPIYSSDGLAN
jgi:hypothetical protein